MKTYKINPDNYTMSVSDHNTLKALGFRNMQIADNKIYTYTFSVFKYKFKSVLECHIHADINSNSFTLNVYNMDGTSYAPFYNESSYINNTVLATVNKNILKEFKRIGIQKIKKQKKVKSCS